MILDDNMNTFIKPFVPLNRIEFLLNKYSPEELLKSNSGAWSILQHLYHCWMVERGVLGYVKLKTQDISLLETVSIITRFKFFFFFALLRLKLLKVKAPTVVQTFPEDISVMDLLDKWGKNREEAAVFFDALPKKVSSKGIFKHVFIGRLNLKLTQKFIQWHLQHHLRLCKL